MAINWRGAPKGTTHHFEDALSEWWFKEGEQGKFYYWHIRRMHSWSGMTCDVEDLAGILTPINGAPILLGLDEEPQPAGQVEVVEQVVAAPKKSIGWW